MWINWNEHDDQPAWGSFLIVVEARCASKKLKLIPSIVSGRTGRLSHQLRDVVSVVSVVKILLADLVVRISDSGSVGIAIEA